VRLVIPKKRTDPISLKDTQGREGGGELSGSECNFSKGRHFVMVIKDSRDFALGKYLLPNVKEIANQ
jgi:hypothetical protein